MTEAMQHATVRPRETKLCGTAAGKIGDAGHRCTDNIGLRTYGSGEGYGGFLFDAQAHRGTFESSQGLKSEVVNDKMQSLHHLG